ncbi:MAG: chorismate mutase, partial [Arenicellales bacterium]
MAKTENIDELRRQIDEIDDKLTRLVNDRIELAAQIGRNKAGGNRGIYRPEREAQIIQRLIDGNSGPLTPASIRAIFREIISAARA